MAKANAVPKMTAQDREWMAKDDARTLALAEEIKMDKSRMGNAQKMAASMADEAMKRATAMNKIAGKDTGPDKAPMMDNGNGSNKGPKKQIKKPTIKGNKSQKSK